MSTPNPKSSRRPTRSLFVALSVLSLPLMLAAGAVSEAQTNPPNQINVSIYVTKDTGDEIGLKVSMEPIPVDAPSEIHWEIDTAGWRFYDRGIKIDDEFLFWKYQFSDEGIEPEDVVRKKPRYKAFDKRSIANKEYKYRIMLTDGKKIVSWDPTIKNQ